MYEKVLFLCGFSVFVLVVLCFGSPLDPSKYHLTDLELNSWIRHYDIARYNHDSLLTQHKRAKRSQASYPIRLDVEGHGRVFKLQLIPDQNVFADDVIFESTTKPRIKFHQNFAYTGTLEDDETAKVHGIITQEGLFEGTIHTQSEDFFVEPVSRYLKEGTTQTPKHHSIVYRVSDVQDPRANTPCASQTFFEQNRLRQKRWLLEADAKLPYDDTNGFFHANKTRNPFNNGNNYAVNQQIDEELEVGNRTNVDVSALIFKNVFKRATVDPKKTTCMLYLQADHQFFQKYGTEEACIEVMTRHVQRVNTIYSNTDFNQDGKKDNITFMVKRIKVHTLEALKDPTYRFPSNYGVEKFLELFSEEDYDAFCLAYMFTYRDFEMGTLGLAWTGDLKNAGGVCEKNGHYRGSMKSLNTGIVTLLNYGKHVPPAVSHVTMAHEIGHNFGSPHDPEQCTPGGEDGNFIMFARATSGDKKNNNRFSPCSLKSINPVLNYKARSAKGCFTEPKAAICGNGVVEDGEECDCGWEEDCRDQCCFPMRRYAPVDEPPCRLTPRSSCSPSQGPCCTAECRVKFGDKCRDDNGCRDESFCNGRDPQCPPSINKPNKTICNKEFVCFMGECTGSICLAYGLESCQCIPTKSDPKTKACELCCKLPGDNQPCISSFDWNDMPYDIPDMFSKPGTPCNDYSGYCDVFQMCREVDPSGPLATLRKLLLSEESIASFRKWIVEYWYAVAAILAAIITLLVLSTKYLGKRPNIKSKSVTIMHSSTTEAVRLPPDGETGVTIHPGVRSKLPLKRKVRNGKVKRKRAKTAADITATNNNVLNSPKKAKITTNKNSPKKKKTSKVSAAVNTTQQEQSRRKTVVENAVMEIIHQAKVKKSTQKSKNPKKKKEIIDYSSVQADVDGKKSENEVVHEPLTPEDAVGKVQNWLKSQYTLPKSKSTPVDLTAEKVPQRRVTNLNKRSSRANDKSAGKKSQSVGNIPSVEKDKVRLQVVYKPPFKFSVKLKKPEKVVSAVIEPVKKPSTARTGLVLVRKCDANKQNCDQTDAVKKPRDSNTATCEQTISGSNNSNIKNSQVSRGVKNSRSAGNILNNTEQNKSVTNEKNAKSLDNIAMPLVDDIDSNIHTVQSDLEVLLSENDD